jgi:catechol 2,3-dioxygenase-like lactoylglutathione lyase family enzyme
MISALKQAMISVDQMDRSLAFYRDFLGFEMILETDVQGPSIEKLWRLRKETTGHVVLLGKPGSQRGRLRLVRFSPRSTTKIRANANQWDLGIFDIGFLGEDAIKNKELFQKKGLSPTAIAFYEIPSYKEMFLREIMIKDPDGVNIVFLHYDAPYKPKGLEGFSEVLHSVIIVSDLEKSLSFYRDLLEMDPQTDMTLNIFDHEPIFRILFSIPKESRIQKVRIISLRREKGFTGRLMLFQFLDRNGNPVGGVDYSSESIPPNIGLCLLAFETDDLHMLESRLRKNEIEIVCSTQRMDGDLFASRNVMTIKSPEGTLLEFAENHPRE